MTTEREKYEQKKKKEKKKKTRNAILSAIEALGMVIAAVIINKNKKS